MASPADIDPEHLPTVKRVRTTAIVSAFVLALGVLIWRGWVSAFALTCGAAVVMINFLWLEEILEKTLRPMPEVQSWRIIVRVVLRFLLLGVA
ncbi:MAG: ATP synthase subunit I, partial [Thermoanaerobaculia bacterium]|nr:ATP synthase subunit I [Thermoanaerobaculia bacterium]